MNRETAQRALIFLRRVDLKGAEVEAMVEVLNAVSGFAAPDELPAEPVAPVAPETDNNDVEDTDAR